MDHNLLTVTEASVAIPYSVMYMYDKIKKGEIPVVRTRGKKDLHSKVCRRGIEAEEEFTSIQISSGG